MISHSRPSISLADRKAVDAVLASGMLAQGGQVAALEAEVARYVGVAGAVATSNGTSALQLALQVLDVCPGQEVIAPTYVCASVVEAICSVGAIPILCDVAENWLVAPENVAPLVNENTAAIIVPHLFGFVADVSSFKSFGVPVIEDACQAFGAKIDGSVVGSVGDLGVYSFHATKCLCAGEGGMLVGGSARLIDDAKEMRNGGQLGLKRLASSMSDLQAALVRSQLSRYQTFLSRREEIASCYNDAFACLDVECPLEVPEGSIYFRYPLKIKGEFELLRGLFFEKGIHVRRGVDALLHKVLKKEGAGFAVSEALFASTMSIPLYPDLADEEVALVVKACREVFG
ncbi:MAG: DegT/DnrJ/EryC1/StrS family aminotransferase [Desulfuromonadales bacterium]|nr:DegT/DnrJ/EryC1/StrS family aminotransferase [Desulfuromonadales bacterium]